jgi:hypothetical protein
MAGLVDTGGLFPVAQPPPRQAKIARMWRLKTVRRRTMQIPVAMKRPPHGRVGVGCAITMSIPDHVWTALTMAPIDRWAVAIDGSHPRPRKG